MITYTYIEKGKFGFVEKPVPTIQHERDAIVMHRRIEPIRIGTEILGYFARFRS